MTPLTPDRTKSRVERTSIVYTVVGAAVTYIADPRVDAYIDALPDWQQAICRDVRQLVHSADPEVTETITCAA